MPATLEPFLKYDDAQLELLANYYTDNNVFERTLFTFQQFLNIHWIGRWHEKVE